MDIVTPAASISFFRPEFDDFLYAPIGTERNEMSLSVLSALARLGVDPWEEAAELSELPKDTATQRLASLIARLPGGRWTQADSRTIATRLIELLPRRFSSKVPLAEEGCGVRGMTGRAAAKILNLRRTSGHCPDRWRRAASLRRGAIKLTRQPSRTTRRRRHHHRVPANDDWHEDALTAHLFRCDGGFAVLSQLERRRWRVGSNTQPRMELRSP